MSERHNTKKEVDVSNENNLAPEEQNMIDYIRRLDEIEVQIEPLKEMKKALKEEFKEEGKLTKDQMSLALRAYRMLKTDIDLDDLLKNYALLRTALRGQ
jgi:L-fucose isomerase-like protein